MINSSIKILIRMAASMSLMIKLCINTTISSHHITTQLLQLQAKKEAAGEIPVGPKHERQLYVGNLPPKIHNHQLVELLNLALLVMKCNIKPGLPALSAWISQDGHYAFVEFRTIEECQNGHSLNQIAIFGHINGQQQGTQQIMMLSQAYSNSVEISNIPKVYENDQDSLTRLLKMFGSYLQFQMKVLSNQILCYCEYENEEQTQKALKGFQDLLVKDSKLAVRRLANGQYQQMFGINNPTPKIDQEEEQELHHSRIVVLKNMLVLENMKSKYEYDDIKDDIYEECAKYGRIVRVFIPKPDHLNYKRLPLNVQLQKYGTYLINDGAGKIFIQFYKSDSAKRCIEGLNKRLYQGREVYACLFSEDKWDQRIYE
ncbi:splicing factor u2af large subunit [Stylonychia lemnae]|uniref:Splicing factor u2af large subunit n=1 Tax=Stylonychia lemnae TaxID=5949 RepID=A0A078AB04_STYLE|nr:splicing factor u2af large subunit [Stylonychia lemnae]|eukprot:CDW78787.1 splicing factor u2af large subunit [Stylonychia lemnae]